MIDKHACGKSEGGSQGTEGFVKQANAPVFRQWRSFGDHLQRPHFCGTERLRSLLVVDVVDTFV